MTSTQDIQVGVRPGDVLAGKYRVERVLGAGGMGVVVAAMHLQLDERVAIKFLLPQALQNPEAIARFDREARAAVKIKSEHVARVSDVGRLDSGAPYMVMEYLEGGDLGAWLRQRGPLPLEQAVEFVLQACEAIAEAHALGIVHRDLKPANLFCVRRADGLLSVKVLDFGISKVGGQSFGAGDMTRTSAVVGSPFYMSPEQMQSSKGVDVRTDIWSLGVILFELTTGRLPFDAEAVTELAIKIATEPAPPVRAFRGDLPAAFEQTIARCLEKDRARRFQTVGELAVALGDFGPPRARASVDRTLRTLGFSPNVTQPLPTRPSTPSQPQAGAVAPGTSASWGHTASRARNSTAAIAAVAVGALVVLAGVGVFVAARFGPSAASHAPGASTPAAVTLDPPPATSPAAPAAASPPAEPADLPSAVPSAAPAASPSAPPPSHPVALPGPTGPAQQSATSVAGSRTGNPGASASPAATARPGPRPSCNPPYVIDSAGHRQYKPECL
jgi:serine/threonine-protein kinase